MRIPQGPISFRFSLLVIPAGAGIQCGDESVKYWIPAPASARGKLCAGMTSVPGIPHGSLADGWALWILLK